jgi:hypothetical protein
MESIITDLERPLRQLLEWILRPQPEAGRQTGEVALRVEVKLECDAVWLTQRHVADLFDTCADYVGLHRKSILGDSALKKAATTEDFLVVRKECAASATNLAQGCE